MKRHSAFPYRHLALADPISAALGGLVAFGILFIVAPIDVSQDFTVQGPVFAVLMYLAFFAGIWSYRNCVRAPKDVRAASAAVIQPGGDYEKLFWWLIILAWIAEAAWLVDRFSYRNVSLVADVLERREAIERNTSTLLSVISAVLCSASFLVWHVALALREQRRFPLWMKALALVTFWMPALNAVVLASRSTAMISLVYMFLLEAYYRRKRLGWVTVSAMLGVICLALLFVVQLFLHRISLINMAAATSIEDSVYAFTLQPKPFLVQALNSSQDNFWGTVLFASSNLAQYYCHGLFELFFQVDNFSRFQHSLGANTFFVPYKFLGMLFPLPDAFDVMKASRPHYGAFGSFFGPLHSDFGWYALLFMILFGWLTAWLYRLAWRSAALVPLYSFLVVTIFFFPVFNVFNVGAGFYMLTGFMVYAIYAGRLAGNRRRSTWGFRPAGMK